MQQPHPLLAHRLPGASCWQVEPALPLNRRLAALGGTSAIEDSTTTTPSTTDEGTEATAADSIATEQDRQQLEQARELIAQDRLAEAAELLTALVLAETPLSDAYHNLACLAVRQNDTDTAIALFGMALDRDPASTTVRRNLALVQSIAQQYEDALATLSPTLRSGQAGREDYALLRELLGIAPALSSIAWARLLADLRAPDAETRKALDEHATLRSQFAALQAENSRLRTEIGELREKVHGEVRHSALVSGSAPHQP
ncbi:tetratricopeptide repeat protein [Thauera sp. SDU_THAU2]|uniref:tetratricopeptide repeat protein n=1 Tax=Thauera sp. SDU_THAU2 TaxID=3136633 RepID=UPI00311E2776